MIPMVDDHGRRMRKLRLSLLDTCNLRCTYCMPEKMEFLPSDQLLSQQEILGITENLLGFGLQEVRVTGGEPTLRREFMDIMVGLSQLPIKRLGLTTNGITLSKYLEDLKHDTDLKSINISLDSLDPDNFKRITRRDLFQRVFKGIVQAQDLGFEVKLNCVLMKGVNDHEIHDFIEFSAQYQVEVRFLELMKIGQANRGSLKDSFMEADEAANQILSRYEMSSLPVAMDSTSYKYKLSNGAVIGFIASESKPFCGSCSRWRLSAEGQLRACLMKEDGVNLRGVSPSDYESRLRELLGMKPIGRIEKIEQDMYQIGG